MVEIEEADRRCLLPASALNRQRHAVGQVLVDSLVAQHARLINVVQVEDDPLRLVSGHPLVEPHQRLDEPVLEDDLTLVGALHCQVLARDVGPSQGDQQVASWDLGVGQFVGLVGSRHGWDLTERIRLSDQAASRGPITGELAAGGIFGRPGRIRRCGLGICV